MLRVLANLFRGIHRAIGITDLPPDATAAQEKKFALLWLAIILFCIGWVVFLFYVLFYRMW
jgi:hypothetical protein